MVVEAEHATANLPRSGTAWVASTAQAGYVGSAYMRSPQDTSTTFDTGYPTTSPELQYQVEVSTPGTYYVWLRGLATNGSNDSVHVGLDGQAVVSADRMTFPTTSYNTWAWFQSTIDGPVATLQVPSAGLHTINVWMREDGFRLDRLLLTTSTSFTPAGDGPPESPRAGTTGSPTPTPTPTP